MSKDYNDRVSSRLITLGLGLLFALSLYPRLAKSNTLQQVDAASNIKHLVVIIQENHSFDNYFGTYCKAVPGSNPQCTDGPECCEAIPTIESKTKKPLRIVSDEDNGDFDPNHTMACELSEINGGKMDQYISSSVCGDERNFSTYAPSVMKPYWDLAQQGALADRYFQPIAGSSSANDMYLARAAFVFKDDDIEPDAIGSFCSYNFIHRAHFTGPTIGDFLMQAGVPWSFYGEGYDAMVHARSLWLCPKPPADCPIQWAFFPCSFDPSDNPFAYYLSSQDKPETMKDLNALSQELKNGTLPAVSFVKALAYKTEHPGYGIKVSAGTAFTSNLIQQIQSSAFGTDTLILVTWDESGGYYDHISPPPTSSVDSQPYGPRVPLIAVGPFARTGTVSHVTMEHSSIVKFIEWNWLGQKTGQLQTRDAEVNNIGSLLDPNKTGTVVP